MASAVQLYRSFWRAIRALPLRKTAALNLARAYRPQLQLLLRDPSTQLDQLDHQVHATIALFRASPKLANAVASLSYHHFPRPIRHTGPRRQAGHHLTTVVWNPQDPGAAAKAWEADAKRRAKDPTAAWAREAAGALQETVRKAERAHGVLLGDIVQERSRPKL